MFLIIKSSQFSKGLFRSGGVPWILENCVESDPDGIQTHDLQNRNLTLYSTKLRDQCCKITDFIWNNQIFA